MPLTPPQTLPELLGRAREIAGRTVGELAAALGMAIPRDPRRSKGTAGTLVERALGADGSTEAAPDFRSLGVELKTIPVDLDGRPAESTFVCSIDLARAAELSWITSAARKKLACVLWVPIEARGRPLGDRRIGAASLWSPDADQERALRSDWELVMRYLAAGHADAVSAHMGRCMQARPKAANARVRRSLVDDEGNSVVTLPLGFYLRRTFTQQLLHPKKL